MRPGENGSLQTALQQPVVEASYSDSELEELLRDTRNQVLLQFNLRLQNIRLLQEQLG